MKITASHLYSSLLAAAVLAAMLSSQQISRAADGRWLGVTGNWSAPGTWFGGEIADDTDFTALFTGVNITANQTITVDTARTIGNLTFTDDPTSSNNLIIAGANPLTLDVTAGAPVVNVTQIARSVTISTVIAGDDGISKSGTGMLILSGINNYTGTSTVNAGNLQFNSPAAIGGSGRSISVAGGAAVSAGYAMDNVFLNRVAESSDAININMAVASTNALDLNSSAGANLPNAVLCGAGATTRSAAWTPNGTVFRLGNVNPTTAFQNATVFTVSAPLSDDGATSRSVVVSGTSPVYLTGALTYTGTTTVGPGAAAGFSATNLDSMGGGPASRSILVASGSSVLRTGGSLNNGFLQRLALTDNAFTIYANNGGSGNALDLTGFPNASLATWDNAGTVSFAFTGTITPANDIYRFGGARAANNINLTTVNALTGDRSVVVGGATLRVQNSNNYTGGTTIRAGIVQVMTNDAALGTGPVTFTGGTRLVVDTGRNITNAIVIGTNTGVTGRGLVEAGTTAGTATVSGPVTINNGSAAGGHFAAPTANTILHVAGPITSTVPISARIGIFMLSGGGTGYPGLTNNQGTVRVGATDGISTSAIANLATSAASTLDLNGFNQSLAGITNGTFAATIGNGSTTSDSTLTTSGTSTFGGTIQDAAGTGTMKVSLTVNGGALTLSGTNTYTGATTITAGTLLIKSPGSLAPASLVTVNAGTLAGNGTIRGSVKVEAGGNLSPGASAGTLFITGGLDVSAQAAGTGTLGFELDALAATSDKIAVTGSLAVGDGVLGFSDFAFTSLTGLETGTYKLITSGGMVGTLDPADLSGAIGSFTGTLQINGNDLELVVSPGVGTPYAFWSGGASFDADANGDGVDNGIAWMLGAASPSANGQAVMPAPGLEPGFLTIRFKRVNNQGPAKLYLDYGNDLTNWTPVEILAASGTVGGDIVVQVTAGSPNDEVTVRIPTTHASPSGRLLARLRATP